MESMWRKRTREILALVVGTSLGMLAIVFLFPLSALLPFSSLMQTLPVRIDIATELQNSFRLTRSGTIIDVKPNTQELVIQFLDQYDKRGTRTIDLFVTSETLIIREHTFSADGVILGKGNDRPGSFDELSVRDAVNFAAVERHERLEALYIRYGTTLF